MWRIVVSGLSSPIANIHLMRLKWVSASLCITIYRPNKINQFRYWWPCEWGQWAHAQHWRECLFNRETKHIIIYIRASFSVIAWNGFILTAHVRRHLNQCHRIKTIRDEKKKRHTNQYRIDASAWYDTRVNTFCIGVWCAHRLFNWHHNSDILSPWFCDMRGCFNNTFVLISLLLIVSQSNCCQHRPYG